MKAGIDEIKTNQPVSLFICLTNTSTNETVYVDSTPPAYNENFTSEVISPGGKDISPRKQPPQQIGFSSGASIPILPQTKFQFGGYNISDFCKFDEIGKYKITISLKINSQVVHGSFPVVSSPLYLIVVPGYWVPETTTNASPYYNSPPS
jgi:hypothetical protein